MICLCLFAWSAGKATVINVTTNDTYTKIEAAKPGDEVVIAPGTYRFRVFLTRKATSDSPINIRAEDPQHPPVWDFGDTLVENAPGSYRAGDRGRGGWQFSGAANYNVSGIIFRHCRTAEFNAAGIRYYNGTTNLYLKDCLFDHNDNGLAGGSQNSSATVEYCEFAGNGNTNAEAPTHNLYIYGGWLTMRYCYVHDPVQAQNFHVRCREAVLEYNWFAHANSFEGDLMTDGDFHGPGPFSQTLTLRGNVFVQMASPINHSQVIALFNDGRIGNLTLNVRALYNTFVGNGGNAAFIHLSNHDGTHMNAEISDNILSGLTRAFLMERTNYAKVQGKNNWLPRGAKTDGLVGTVQSASPGFRDAATGDYRLAKDSPCIGAADSDVSGVPDKECEFGGEGERRWKARGTARDIGAFESGSE